MQNEVLGEIHVDFSNPTKQTDVLATSSSAIILALGVKPGAAGESSPGGGLYEGSKWGRHRRRGGCFLPAMNNGFSHCIFFMVWVTIGCSISQASC